VNRKYGYVRVSTKDQNIERQIEALKAEGIEERDIFIDKESGKDFNRTEYNLLKRILREGDLLVVKELDRFGRNYNEIGVEWNYITKTLKADIKVLDMPLLDTTLHKDLLGTFIADLVRTILSYGAETERQKILKRTKEGREIAKAKGVHMGRPKKDLDSLSKEDREKFDALYKSWKAEEITAKKFMEQMGMSHANFYRVIKKLEDNAS
jgi:DNA invertase Pin-like site-specific DNA recombinase